MDRKSKKKTIQNAGGLLPAVMGGIDHCCGTKACFLLYLQNMLSILVGNNQNSLEETKQA